MSVLGTLAAGVSLLYAMASGPGPIRVADDFESGNLGKWRVENDTRLVFAPRLEFDQDRVNSAMTWFYGRLSNVLNREINIVIQGLEYTVYDGRKGNIFPYERNTVPVFSYDGAVWERFTDCAFHKESQTFRIRHIFSRDTVWIAYVPPYTFARLESLLAGLRNNPIVKVETVGKSVEGRPLYLVNVAEPGAAGADLPVAWIVARQHAFEAGGTWAAEGLLEFLAGRDPEARAIRKRVVFKVCPMLNPDGVVKGNTRFNARGVDLNRHWSEEDPLSRNLELVPEIGLVKEAVRKWRESHRLDLWINLHNNDMVWNDDGDYIRFAPKERAAEARRLESLLRAGTIFTGPCESAPTGFATEAVVAKETGALGFLMEMKTGYLEREARWTGIDLFLAHGRGLAVAVSKFFERQ